MSDAQIEANVPITVTIQRAKELSGLGDTKIWQLIHDRRLEVVRVDRRVLITFASLKRLLSPTEGAPVFSMTDTWNSGDIPFNATKMNVTDVDYRLYHSVGDEPPRKVYDSTAAAEVGQDDDMNRALVMDMSLHDEIRATIERCARVADKAANPIQTVWSIHEIQAIAAAIRALKDKP